MKCPHCGFSAADFKKSGRLGCECYRLCQKGLFRLLKTMHKGTHHIGKTPEALRRSRESVDQPENASEKLARAIEMEDFETAAVLRGRDQDLDRRPPGKAGQ